MADIIKLGTSIVVCATLENQEAMRPNWQEYFINIAKQVASRSSCPRASCGSVIVSKDNHILSTGYNGAPSGQPHCIEIGCRVEDEHCQTSLHSEVNAIAWAARKGIPLEGARLYLWSDKYKSPCRECIKVLIAAGVTW